jgi:hypothetical protein
MNFILVDPYLFRVPTSGTPDELRDFLDNLVDWCEVLGKYRTRCATCEDCIYAFMDEGCDINRARISNILQSCNISEYSVVDIMRSVGRLTDERPYIRDRVGLRDCISTNHSVEPPLFLQRLGALGARKFLDTLLLTLLSGDCYFRNSIVATSSLPRNIDPAWEAIAVNVRGEIDMVQDLSGELIVWNVGAAGYFRLAVSHADVESITEPETLTALYSDPSAAISFILSNYMACDNATLPQIFAGAGFIASLESHNIHRQPTVLFATYHRAALAAIGRLHELPGAKLHPVRTSKSGNASQVHRASDDATLWRCMVTQSGAGYRLHYWRLPSGAVELVKVMVESEC